MSFKIKYILKVHPHSYWLDLQSLEHRVTVERFGIDLWSLPHDKPTPPAFIVKPVKDILNLELAYTVLLERDQKRKI